VSIGRALAPGLFFAPAAASEAGSKLKLVSSLDPRRPNIIQF
jgi:hypothetical protein